MLMRQRLSSQASFLLNDKGDLAGAEILARVFFNARRTFEFLCIKATHGAWCLEALENNYKYIKYTFIQANY